jgi:sugar lactone lactonase YvrE
LAAFILSLCGCGPGNPPEIEKPFVNQPILNLQPRRTVGPSLGNGINLSDPAAVAVNALNEIYIADRARNTIYKLSPSFELIAAEGGIGSGAGSLNRPVGLAFDAALNLYVAETGNHRISVLDRNLHFVRNYTAYIDESDESVDFISPSDVSLDREGNVWVADDSRALKLSPFFDLQLEISNDSPGYPILGEIVSLRAARGDLVAIGDRGSRQIVLVRTLGAYVDKFYTDDANSLAWDNNGNIWVASNGRILAYDLNGHIKFEFADAESNSRITWLAFDTAGMLYALDSGAGRLKIFEIIYGAAVN